MFASVKKTATAAYGTANAVCTKLRIDVLGVSYIVEFHTGPLAPWFGVQSEGINAPRNGRTYRSCTEVATVILERELRRRGIDRAPKSDAVDTFAHLVHIWIERSRDEFKAAA